VNLLRTTTTIRTKQTTKAAKTTMPGQRSCENSLQEKKRNGMEMEQNLGANKQRERLNRRLKGWLKERAAVKSAQMSCACAERK